MKHLLFVLSFTLLFSSVLCAQDSTLSDYRNFVQASWGINLPVGLLNRHPYYGAIGQNLQMTFGGSIDNSHFGYFVKTQIALIQPNKSRYLEGLTARDPSRTYSNAEMEEIGLLNQSAGFYYETYPLKPLRFRPYVGVSLISLISEGTNTFEADENGNSILYEERREEATTGNDSYELGIDVLYAHSNFYLGMNLSYFHSFRDPPKVNRISRNPLAREGLQRGGEKIFFSKNEQRIEMFQLQFHMGVNF